MKKTLRIWGTVYTQYLRVTDGRTDGQTSCHGIVRAMHTRRALKTGLYDISTQPGQKFFNLNKILEITYASFDSLCCLINIKVKSFKNIQCFYLNVRCQKLQQMFKVLSLSLDTAHKSHDRFATRLLPVDDKLFEVSPGLRFLGVSRRYCCYVNHACSRPHRNHY